VFKKFKKGDKVMRTDYDYGEIKVGDILTVASFTNSGTIRVEESPRYSYDAQYFMLTDEIQGEVL